MTLEIYKGTEVKLWLDYDIIGRASSCTVRLSNELEEYHEIGDRDTVEIVPKNRMVSGTLERALINGMLFAKVLNKYTESDGIYTVTADDYQNPITSVTDESIAADDTQTLFKLDYGPPIYGTVVIEQDDVAYGTEGIEYIIDYENWLITFSSPPSSGNTWTSNYSYGRSYTLTGVFQRGDGTEQRFDVTVGGLMFDTWENTINNTGDISMESVDFKAKTISGITLGTPGTGA